MLKEHGKATYFEQIEKRTSQGTEKNEEKKKIHCFVSQQSLEFTCCNKTKRLVKDLTLLSHTTSIENKLRKIEKKNRVHILSPMMENPTNFLLLAIPEYIANLTWF